MEKYYILIQAVIVLLIFLMGTFTAKRFNFLHGAIALIAIITFISGISAIICQYGLEGGKELGIDSYKINISAAYTDGLEYIKGASGTLEIINRYLIFFTLPLQIVSTFFVNSVLAFDLPETILEYAWILYFIPTVIWLVSRIIAGIIRR